MLSVLGIEIIFIYFLTLGILFVIIPLRFFILAAVVSTILFIVSQTIVYFALSLAII